MIERPPFIMKGGRPYSKSVERDYDSSIVITPLVPSTVIH